MAEKPVLLTLVAVQVTARHQVCTWPFAASRKYDTVNKMREPRYIDNLEFLEIAGVQARIPRDQHLSINQCSGFSVAV